MRHVDTDEFVGLTYRLVPTIDLITIDYYDFLSKNEYYKRLKKISDNLKITKMFLRIYPISNNTRLMPLFVIDGVVEKWRAIAKGTIFSSDLGAPLQVPQPQGTLTIAVNGPSTDDKWFMVFSFVVELGTINKDELHRINAQDSADMVVQKRVVLNSSNSYYYENRDTNIKKMDFKSGPIPIVERSDLRTASLINSHGTRKLKLQEDGNSLLSNNSSLTNQISLEYSIRDFNKRFDDGPPIKCNKFIDDRTTSNKRKDKENDLDKTFQIKQQIRVDDGRSMTIDNLDDLLSDGSQLSDS